MRPQRPPLQRRPQRRQQAAHAVGGHTDRGRASRRAEHYSAAGWNRGPVGRRARRHGQDRRGGGISAASLPAGTGAASRTKVTECRGAPSPPTATPTPPAPASSGATAPPAPAPAPDDWRKTTAADIDRAIDFTRLPPDSGIVTPIAALDEQPDPEVSQQLDLMHSRLPTWPPAKDPDTVQRVRNLLYVAAVPDVLQTPIERFAPLEIYDRLEQDVPREQLIQALFWIALHPDGRRPLGHRRSCRSSASTTAASTSKRRAIALRSTR